PVPLPSGRIRGVSFDYGHVLGGLDLHELADRLAHGPGRSPDLDAIRAAMPTAYAAHDRAIAAGEGHEAAWYALVGALVEAGGSHPGADARRAAVDALWAA